MANTIHYIHDNWGSSFIIATTSCGRDWGEVNEHTSQKQHVTCKKCLKSLEKENSEKKG